jgi:hypothetical protein
MSDTPRDRKSVRPFIKASRRSEIVAKLAAEAASLALATIGAAQAADKSAEVAKGHAETHSTAEARKASMPMPGVILASDPDPSQPVKTKEQAKDDKETKELKEAKDEAKDGISDSPFGSGDGDGDGDGTTMADDDISAVITGMHVQPELSASELGNTRNLPAVRFDTTTWTQLTAEACALRLKPATLLMRKPIV